MKSGGKVQLRSRNDNDFNVRIPASCRRWRRCPMKRSSTERSWRSINGEQTFMCSHAAGTQASLVFAFRNSTLIDRSGEATRGEPRSRHMAFRVRSWSDQRTTSGTSLITAFSKIESQRLGCDRVGLSSLGRRSEKNHETKLRHQDENGKTRGIRLSASRNRSSSDHSWESLRR
jgi:hypothetical protein